MCDLKGGGQAGDRPGPAESNPLDGGVSCQLRLPSCQVKMTLRVVIGSGQAFLDDSPTGSPMAGSCGVLGGVPQVRRPTPVWLACSWVVWLMAQLGLRCL